MGQGQEGLQPAQLVAAVERDVVPALGARDHRAHRDDQDISQPMLDLAGTSRICGAEKCSTSFSTDIATLPSLIKGEPAQPVSPSEPARPFHALPLTGEPM